MILTYSGVGSRETPSDVLAEFRALARVLAIAGWTLRSGGADGADLAFETGAREISTASLEIYLPWKGFNENPSQLYGVDEAALQLAATVHPAWASCRETVRKLHARNCYQVLGRELNAPARFLVCWTPDGCESEWMRSRNTGGTATAIVLAERNKVPVFNLQKDGRRAALGAFLATLGVQLQRSTLQADQSSLF